MTWQPAWKVAPKEIIREEMDERGWDTKVLASEAQWASRLAAEVLQGRKITRLLAIGLAQAFGTSEQLWVNLQTAYDALEGEPVARAKRRGVKPAPRRVEPATHLPVSVSEHVNGAEVPV